MSRIPEETIHAIREQTDIVQIISQYLQLRKSGQNYFASCPFHDDKTPSFSVSEKKQIYHCFSCGRGGNVFSFLQEIDGLTFVEAVGKTAEMADIKVDQAVFDQARQSRPKADSTHAKLLSVYEKAEHFYHHILMNTQAGEEAYQYLIDRGMSKESIETFKIGFSPPQRQALKLYLDNEDLNDSAVLKKSGLFSDRDDDTFVDRFSNRILFPIKDKRGQTVAFSGRAFLETENSHRTAKYMNSPETELFNKRRILFNYDKARPAIRREGEVVLFEGFMDVISAWEAGVKNGIATMGTSLTEEQVRVLDKATDHIVLAYDGDSAGMEATKRAADFVSKETHFSIEVASFPENLDPDDFIQTRGQEAFKEFLSHGRDTLVSFLMKYHRRDVNLKNESERLKYIEVVLKELARVTSAVERELYLNQLKDEFDLSLDALKEQLQMFVVEQQNARRKEKRQDKQNQQQEAEPTVVFHHNKPAVTSLIRAEKALLHRLFTQDEVWSVLSASEKDLIFSEQDHQLLYLIYDEYYHSREERSLQDFLDYLPDEKLKSKASEIAWISMSDDIAPGEIEDYLNVICDRQPLENQLKQKQMELKDAQRSGDKSRQQSLSIEIINLIKKMKSK
ncbi:DNA primase [Alkalibacterium sp. AK22]|uniref:DNA primase n=1 Tax=Alkalibacterium sp. AK22 TaxID=1229520 RepID=UPI0004469B81|nr:DNA primase [Alkalibacterium sp. AK22]EXJ22475.1 DNA primase [Alkalibacterium sp. AK22]